MSKQIKYKGINNYKITLILYFIVICTNYYLTGTSNFLHNILGNSFILWKERFILISIILITLGVYYVWQKAIEKNYRIPWIDAIILSYIITIFGILTYPSIVLKNNLLIYFSQKIFILSILYAFSKFLNSVKNLVKLNQVQTDEKITFSNLLLLLIFFEIGTYFTNHNIIVLTVLCLPIFFSILFFKDKFDLFECFITIVISILLLIILIAPVSFTISFTWYSSKYLFLGLSSAKIPSTIYYSVSIFVGFIILLIFGILSVFLYSEGLKAFYKSILTKIFIKKFKEYAKNPELAIKIIIDEQFNEFKSIIQILEIIYSDNTKKAIDFILELRNKGLLSDDKIDRMLNKIWKFSELNIINDIEYLCNSFYGKAFIKEFKGNSNELLNIYKNILNSDQHSETRKHLGSIVNYLKYHSSINKSKEYLCFFEYLNSYLNAETFQQIASLYNASGLKNLTVKSFIEIIELFNNCIFILTRSLKVSLQNKISYFAKAFEELSKIEKIIDYNTNPVIVKICKHNLNNWRAVITRELSTLKGSSQLEFKFLSKFFRPAETITIPIQLSNIGNSVAENILIDFGLDEDIINKDQILEIIDIVAPSEKILLEPIIKGKQEKKIRFPLKAKYNDLSESSKLIEYADIIEILDDTNDKQESYYKNDYINPYIAGKPIKGKEMFFGRIDIINYVKDYLEGKYENNVIVLYGERRTGKTTILYQLCDVFKDKYIPVLIDMQAISNFSLDKLLWEISLEIWRNLRAIKINISEPDFKDFDKNSQLYFKNTFIPEILKCTGKKILLLLDEFDMLIEKVKSGILSEDVFVYFRSIIQHVPNILFIFSGTHRLQEMSKDYWSILFNIALFKKISLIQKNDAIDLIKKPVKDFYEYDILAIDKIWNAASGHPYYIQLICQRIFNIYKKEKRNYMNIQDADNAINEIIDTQTHVNYVWSDATDIERILLATIGELIKYEGGIIFAPMIYSFLKDYRLDISLNDVIASLHLLESKGILSSNKNDDGFKFNIDLVRRWISKYKSLEKTLNLIKNDSI